MKEIGRLMKQDKRKRLEARGWKFGTVKEFLGLTDEEAAYIELRLKLTDGPVSIRWVGCATNCFTPLIGIDPVLPLTD